MDALTAQLTEAKDALADLEEENEQHLEASETLQEQLEEYEESITSLEEQLDALPEM